MQIDLRKEKIFVKIPPVQQTLSKIKLVDITKTPFVAR